MILTGPQIISRNILRNLFCPATQVQPCGIDLTLKRVLRFDSPGSLDFDNVHRTTAATTPIPFTSLLTNGHTASDPNQGKAGKAVLELSQGAYLLEFNETIATPLDVMDQIFQRSSLFRSGASVSAGVMDAGYEGVVGALLNVYTVHGIVLHRDARVAQMVFHMMDGVTGGYKGGYQGREAM